MTRQAQLVPVSFHLRQFNKYTKLDLSASERGNLTLIGENAAGKTTLANCFFPMLIDGSIATPSFNPAKGTDRIDSHGKPRNSARDTRTFDSMLLGWGAGAMKVRTGYTYMRLASTQRQVILGIGAQRTVGENRKPTWWFVVISEQPDPVKLITTDSAGQGLLKDEFITANADLGSSLVVFDQATAYQEYVTSKAYGFDSVSVLEKLASVYRLLASPILTAGNARFTPIREALKNAQAGIDSQIIQEVAASQRDVNRMNGVLQRIVRVSERLARMKKEVFWRNLNHLDENQLRDYNKAHQNFEQKQTAKSRFEKQIVTLTEQLGLLATTLKHTETTLADLRREQAKQDEIKDRRQQYKDQITTLRQELKNFKAQQANLADQQAKLLTAEQEQSGLEADQQHLINHELRPLQAELSAKVTELPSLKNVLTEIDLAKIVGRLSEYIQQNRLNLTDYQANLNEQAHLSRDVEIVHDIRLDLDGRIERRVQGPMTNHFKTGLLGDNLAAHNTGAEKMNENLAPLLAQAEQLLVNNPDLRVFDDQPELLDWLTQRYQALTTVIAKKDKLANQIDKLIDREAILDDQIKKIKQLMPKDYHVDAAVERIEALVVQRDALKIDEQIEQHVKEAKQTYEQVIKNRDKLLSQRAGLQGKVTSADADMTEYRAELKAISGKLVLALRTLAPYFPEDLDIANVTELIDYTQQHRAEIRQASWGDLTSQISKLIHRNDESGIDRYAIDDLFEERHHASEVSAIHQQRSVEENGITTVAFDINHAQALMAADQVAVTKALEQLKVGNDVAQVAYMGAATNLITTQYHLIDDYNQMLSAGVNREQSIKLKVTLEPSEVDQSVIDEARDPHLDERPQLLGEVQKRLTKLANDTTLIDDNDFMAAAKQLLDTRQWSTFQVLIKRRQNGEDDYEIVDDKFVQSGGSGAEKAQAMVLPLLLVPKMLLQRATATDAPYWVMFDEFADKLDPETAKLFAKTIARFGFNFIATMPGGAQNKILADGVDNIAYDVIAAGNQSDGQFHKNIVRQALIWQLERQHEHLS